MTANSSAAPASLVPAQPAATAADTIAIVAHGMLNSMAVIVWSAETLRDRDDLDPAARELILDRLVTQSRFVSLTLHDAVRASYSDPAPGFPSMSEGR